MCVLYALHGLAHEELKAYIYLANDTRHSYHVAYEAGQPGKIATELEQGPGVTFNPLMLVTRSHLYLEVEAIVNTLNFTILVKTSEFKKDL